MLIIAIVETGYVSFFSFAIVHGVLFIAVTLCVWFFKTEAPVAPDEQVEDMKTVYIQMAQVSIVSVANVILFSVTFSFSFFVMVCESICVVVLSFRFALSYSWYLMVVDTIGSLSG